MDYYQLFHLHYERGGFDSFEAFDERFRGTQFIYNWVQDLEMELHNAGLDKPVYFEHRIRFGEEGLPLDQLGELASQLRQTPPHDRGKLAQSKIGCNDPCPCGSGRKYKKCCGKN